MSADRQVEAEPVQLKQRTRIPSSRQRFQAADILLFQAARDPIMTSARAFKLFTKYYLVDLNSSLHIYKYKSHSFKYAAGKLTVQIYSKFYKRSTQKKIFFFFVKMCFPWAASQHTEAWSEGLHWPVRIKTNHYGAQTTPL